MYVKAPNKPPTVTEPTNAFKRGKPPGGAGKGPASAGKGTAGAGKGAATAEPAMARVGFIDDVVTDAEAGAPLKVVAPCEGTANDVGALSIVKGARNLDNAKKFVDWALGAKAQALGARAKQFQYPANTSVPASPLLPKYADIKFINYDSAKYDKSVERKRLIERWEQEFGPVVK
jgi:iron(III) transport system substrate-binding protein